MNKILKILKRDVIIAYEKEVNNLTHQQAKDLVDMMDEEQFEYAYRYSIDNGFLP